MLTQGNQKLRLLAKQTIKRSTSDGPSYIRTVRDVVVERPSHAKGTADIDGRTVNVWTAKLSANGVARGATWYIGLHPNNQRGRPAGGKGARNQKIPSGRCSEIVRRFLLETGTGVIEDVILSSQQFRTWHREQSS